MANGERMERDKLTFLASLRTKIILGTGLVMVIVLGIFMYLDVLSRRSGLLEAEEKCALDVSYTLMKSIEHPMLDGEMDQVQILLQKVIELEDMRVAYISGLSGAIVYTGVPDSRGKVSRSETVKEALRTNALAKGLKYTGEKRYSVMPCPSRMRSTVLSAMEAKRGCWGYCWWGLPGGL